MLDSLLSKNILPDFIVRFGIRRLLKQRILEDIGSTEDEIRNLTKSFIEKQNSYDSIAINTLDANEQHYEVPPKFYEYCLGENLKYSSGYWDNANDLNEAELDMINLTIERAQLKDSEHILELGCGWGSLTINMAKKFPNAQITGVSNSKDQREYILNKAKSLGLNNIDIITCDINKLELEKKYDRIVSVEMFEHMRNYKKLLEKVTSFLKDNGTIFIHIFVHKSTPYFFDVKDDSDWMSKYFFSGGIMPSDKLLYEYSDLVEVINHDIVNGTHYSKTAQAWLQNTDKNKEDVLKLFSEHYGESEATRWYSYWRIFFMACSELWKYDHGNEWFVSHYLLKKAKVN